MKSSIKDFFCKCDQIRSFLWIWPHLLKKSFMENFIFCAVLVFGVRFELVFMLASKMLALSVGFEIITEPDKLQSIRK